MLTVFVCSMQDCGNWIGSSLICGENVEFGIVFKWEYNQISEC